FLIPGKASYFGGWVTYLDRRCYPGWGRLSEAVRTNSPTTWNTAEQENSFDEDPALTRVFQDAMHSLSRSSAAIVAAALDLSTARRLLDVGGGTAACAIELARGHQHLAIGVYDLPAVCALAEEKIAEAGLGSRIQAVAGDFLTDELP